MTGQTREARVRARLFPDEATYDRKQGAFTALPIVLRRVQALFQPREWQVYTYIMMRTGPEGMAWFPLTEMSWDLDFKSVSKLRPYVDSLEKKGWIRRTQSAGQDYYLVRDPLLVIAEMKQQKMFNNERRHALAELLELLNLQLPKPRSTSPAEAPSGAA